MLIQLVESKLGMIDRFAETFKQKKRRRLNGQMLIDHRSDLGSPISLSAIATERGCRLIPAVSLRRQLPLAPLLQSMAVV